MKQIGLYGGSFDPVHRGHLLVAQAAFEELGLDRLFFIPAARSPFKPDAAPLEGRLRVRLLRLALAGRSEYEVCESELEQGGVSFTIDTIDRFAQRFPDANLTYLIGADHVTTLPQWKDAPRLAQRVTFGVIPRPGAPSVTPPEGFRCRQLKGFPLGVSSSTIRDRIRRGQSIREIVPRNVAESIERYRLYLPD